MNVIEMNGPQDLYAAISNIKFSQQSPFSRFLAAYKNYTTCCKCVRTKKKEVLDSIFANFKNGVPESDINLIKSALNATTIIILLSGEKILEI